MSKKNENKYDNNNTRNISIKNDDNNNNNDNKMKKLSIEKKVNKESDQVSSGTFTKILLLAVLYSTVTFSRQALGTTGPVLMEDKILTSSALSYNIIQSYGTGGYCIGKFFWALIGHKLGGLLCVCIGLFGSSVGGFACSMSTSATVFATFWTFQMFFSSSIWGGIGKIVRESIDESHYGKCYGTLGISSRVGAMLGSLVLTTFLRRSHDWRISFTVAFVTMSIISSFCCLGMYFVKGSTRMEEQQHREVVLTGGQQDDDENTKLLGNNSDQQKNATVDNKPRSLKSFVLDVCVKDTRFWLIFFCSILLAVFMELQFFVPIFLQEHFLFESTESGYGTAFFAGGSLIAALLASLIYDNLSWNNRLYYICGSLVEAGLSLLVLNYVEHRECDAHSFIKASLVLMGVSMGISGPYYMVVSEFALLAGGDNYSNFLINVFDAVGYVGCIVFDVYGYRLAADFGWSYLLVCISAAVFICSILLACYYSLDPSNSKRHE